MIPRRDSHPAPATPHAPRGYPLTTAGLRTATFSDGMHMYTERLQILVTPEQRRKLESEAEHRGESVGSLVRKAVDAAYDPVDRDGPLTEGSICLRACAEWIRSTRQP